MCNRKAAQYNDRSPSLVSCLPVRALSSPKYKYVLEVPFGCCKKYKRVSLIARFARFFVTHESYDPIILFLELSIAHHA